MHDNMTLGNTDEYYMRLALREAAEGLRKGEVPVGAIVVCQDRVIARAHNQTEQLNDTTAHAEMLALTGASAFLHNKYLKDCTLYVTLEPCVMCAGALYWSQIGRIVYAAEDAKRGFMRHGKELLHPKTKLAYGILHKEAAALVKHFFETKRKTNTSQK